MPDVCQGFVDRPTLTEMQRERLRALLHEVVPANPFYREKLERAGLGVQDVDYPECFTRLPFTTKDELLADQKDHPPYGRDLTYPPERYCRLHQTSGTLGRPLRWLDTKESWRWVLDCWDLIFDFAGVRPDDRLFFPFSFGPFLGFWAAFDAAARRGLFCLPGGGMSTGARLRFMAENQATVVFCTPTYALRLAEVAGNEGFDLKGVGVRTLIVAGEPGGSIPATRARIESAWGARLFDHPGLTEVGSAMMECRENPNGVHVLESEFVAEVIDPATGKPVAADEPGELVLTNLGRTGSPLLRYRTGDLVRVDPKPCPCGRSFVRLEGGILGRTDDMVHLRGNNLYPTALEAVVRCFPEVAEYRVVVDRSAPIADLRIEVETYPGSPDNIPERIARAVRDELLFRAEVVTAPPGSLPRFEMKARRLVIRDS